MLKTCSQKKSNKIAKYQWCLRIQEMENSCRITIGKKIWKNHFFELRSRLQQQDTKSRASKCWFLRKTGGHTWWEWFRIVPGPVLSIESKNGVRISKNKKIQFFCILSKSGKYPKGGPLEEKKFKVLQSGRNLQDWWGPSKKQAGKWFWSVLAPCWGLRDQKVEDFGGKKNTKSGGLEVYSERNPHFWEENHQKWRFFKFWQKI